MATKRELLVDRQRLKEQLLGVRLLAQEIEDNLDGIRHAIAANSAVSLDTIGVLEQEVTRLNNYLLEAGNYGKKTDSAT